MKITRKKTEIEFDRDKDGDVYIEVTTTNPSSSFAFYLFKHELEQVMDWLNERNDAAKSPQEGK